MVILAVDDDPEDFEFFTEAVMDIDKSIVVLTATNGQQALDLLNNLIIAPDFIFLDINMPVMDGRKCLEAIRGNPRFRDIRVVMYSTTTNKEEIRQCKLMNAGFLVKPDKFSTLVKSLSFILGYSTEKPKSIFLVL
ncbi:hypothetical protein AWW69_15665 [Bacillus cereus]|nr:hypothetical protein AWW69_15665 [Bacillus cereus]